MSIRSLLPILLAAATVSFAADDLRLMEMLPAGPSTVAGFNVQQVLASPFGRQLLSQMKGDEPQLRRLFELTGFDPRRDLRDVVLATYVRPGLADRTLLMARGNFDVPRLRTELLKNGPIAEFLGVSLFNSASDGSSFAFSNDGLALAGDAISIREALTLRQSGASALGSTLSQRTKQMSAQYDIWMFTATPASAVSNRLDDSLVEAASRHTPLLRSVTQASGGIKFGETVTIAGEALMRSEKDATAAADILRLVASLARMAPDRLPNADFISLFEALQVRAEAGSLSLSFAIPQAQLIRLFNSSTRPAREALI